MISTKTFGMRFFRTLSALSLLAPVANPISATPCTESLGVARETGAGDCSASIMATLRCLPRT